ncbi:MAG TPA: ABC transporter substrate-binding protein, partial [Acidobacteriota bacterium]
AGEAGAGKSRLLDELEHLARHRNIQVLRGRVMEEDQAFPYQAFCGLILEYFRKRSIFPDSIDFADLAEDLRSLFPPLAEIVELKSPLPEGTRPSKDKTYAYELLARTLLRIASGKPIVLLFEDLHAAGVSIEALQYVIRRLGPTPTLIVGSYRSTETSKQHPLVHMQTGFYGDRRFQLITLAPLKRNQYQSFIESLLGVSRLEPTVTRMLFEATEGNPYFSKELVRSLLDSGGLFSDEQGNYSLATESGMITDLPATIHQTVERRIERLPEALRQLLSLASVLGKTFELEDLQALAGFQENVEEAVEKLQQEGFIEEARSSRGDQWNFSSVIVRDVLYGALSRRKRRSLHCKYAEYLEERHRGRLQRIYPQLLHHFSQADVSEKVTEYGFRLAKKSLDSFSAQEAVHALKTVLDFLNEDHPEGRLLEAEARTLLADAYRMSGKPETALKELKTVIDIFENLKQDRPAVGAVVKAAEIAWQVRKVEETRIWVDKGLETARKIDDEESLVRLLLLGATVANLRGEYEKAKTYFDEAAQRQPSSTAQEASIPRGGKLVVAMPNLIQAGHPAQMKINEEWEVLANVFETLLITDEQGRLMPHLCDRWEIVNEGKSFLLTLRPNVLLHNGKHLTALEVKKSFERAIRLVPNELPPAYAAIRGVAAYLEGTAAEVAGLAVLALNRLAIELEDPLPIYPSLLTDIRTGIADLSKDSDAFCGTGPFTISFIQHKHVVIKRHQEYWKTLPPVLDAVEFRAGLSSADIAAGLRAGEIDLARDLLPADLEEILRDSRLHAGLVEAPKKNVYFILFHQSSPVCRIPEVREAIAGMIRTHDLVRSTLGRFAQPAEGFIPPAVLGHDPARRRQPLSREDAFQLLRSTSLPLPLSLRASVHPIFQDRYATLLNALFRIWNEIGVEVSIETTTMTSYMQRQQENEGIDLMIGRWNADYDDPDSFTHGLFHSTMGRLRSYFSSQKMDSMIEEGRLTHPPLRERIYRRIETALLESNILFPLFHDIDYR